MSRDRGKWFTTKNLIEFRAQTNNNPPTTIAGIQIAYVVLPPR